MSIPPESLPSCYERVLDLAEKGWGTTHPNPMVGALIVEGGEVVAEGFHRKCGGPHAEVEALDSLGRKPSPDASMVISLEPCSTHGKTPPCTEAILHSGIQTVCVAGLDPNPRHAGNGIEILRDKGVTVELAGSDIRERAERLNFIFNHNMQAGRPLIALKLAESINRKLAEAAGSPSQVTGDAARADVMRWRRLFPAICVGKGTVLADNPGLTARLPGETWCPLRLVLDSSLSTLDAAVPDRKSYVDAFADRTRILTTSQGLAQKDRVARARQLGLSLIEVEACPRGRVSTLALPQLLDQLGLNALYVEGGAEVAQSLLDDGLADYLFRYQSPREFLGPSAVTSPLPKKLRLRDPIELEFGPDRLTHGFL